jgi:hypothetical protein
MTTNKEIIAIAVLFALAMSVVIMDLFFWRAI